MVIAFLKRPTLLAVGITLVILQAAWGQEVKWRLDYASARREANEKDLPLVIDFGTENCYWCKQLDLRTFRDASVVNAMNERFVPLKIDATRNAELAEKLRIQSYPTIVIASPDGKILDTIEGFKEAGPFQDILQRALTSVVAADPLKRDYQEATKAIASSNYVRAVSLLKKVSEDKKDHPVQGKARQLLGDLEQQAAGRLSQARQQVDRGQKAEAADTLKELVRAYAGTAAAGEGAQILTALAQRPEPGSESRTRRARELLVQAREDFRTQQFLGCMDRCETLTTHFSDLPEAAEALQLASQIKNNPELMKQICDRLSDRLSNSYLALAETWLKNGQPHQAVMYLERVIQTFPGTRHAEAAQIRLLQIQGQPTRPVGYKNP